MYALLMYENFIAQYRVGLNCRIRTFNVFIFHFVHFKKIIGIFSITLIKIIINHIFMNENGISRTISDLESDLLIRA